MKKAVSSVLAALAICVFLSGCHRGTYTGTMDAKERNKFNNLTSEIARSSNYEKNYVYITQICNILDSHEKGLSELFLSEYVDERPTDPYNALYLFMVAKYQEENGDEDSAMTSFERALHSYADVNCRGKSVHLQCLTIIADKSKDNRKKIECYEELLSRFPDDVNACEIYFCIGSIYSDLEEWENAAQAYKKFLSHPDSELSENYKWYKQASDFMMYYGKKITWSCKDLDTLIANITAALKTKKSSAIKKYVSKAQFFMSSWEKQAESPETLAINNIGSFINKNMVIDKIPDGISNSQEAYLKTTGWDYRLNTWYLYFRRINFPADKEIDGNWEWAGIYFGDRVFSKSNE